MPGERNGMKASILEEEVEEWMKAVHHGEDRMYLPHLPLLLYPYIIKICKYLKNNL